METKRSEARNSLIPRNLGVDRTFSCCDLSLYSTSIEAARAGARRHASGICSDKFVAVRTRRTKDERVSQASVPVLGGLLAELIEFRQALGEQHQELIQEEKKWISENNYQGAFQCNKTRNDLNKKIAEIDKKILQQNPVMKSEVEPRSGIRAKKRIRKGKTRCYAQSKRLCESYNKGIEVLKKRIETLPDNSEEKEAATRLYDTLLCKVKFIKKWRLREMRKGK